MKTYGLIGYPLGHSFSKKYFTEKYQKEGIEGCQYELFELEKIDIFADLLSNKSLSGINVTIPYKEQVIPFMDRLDPNTAGKIGAVNVIKFEEDGTLTGYNSDYFGFRTSLEKFIPNTNFKALVLGTGGASKAIKVALTDLEIPFKSVSRNRSEDSIAYTDVTDELYASHTLIINTTPLGMHPNEGIAPKLPYDKTTENHYFFDVVYNPEVTEFMKLGVENDGHAKNGHEMLIGQAEASWEIWNKD
ncbi:shikimate dehydrogenase family protein [Flammeovirga kamogawensis]|uniref:Shikimate dehydrogenase n=1 Tax=Flammeovirga kamogawensis TaxID=373891 RepID=A0ABX8GTV3_9BACT|nr:shikimate dehydrogenase [Flammeovirga kamogawensis]MBB6461473.1 shikimate dehydrogenase [Flammeovirga kamogawensis]QWG06365.1 shikimate dehydrogenase [Flammeovirga kamogawensis]TRX68194.1 shikimate dehydrogenase [Flammeovirga kamogawensis]